MLENIEANTTISVNVAVIDLGGEVDLGGSEGIVRRENNREEEKTTLIRRILRANNRSSPLVEIVGAHRTSSNVLKRLFKGGKLNIIM